MDIYVIVPIEEVSLAGLSTQGLRLDDDCIVFPDKEDVLLFTDLPLCANGRRVREVIGEVGRNAIERAGAVTFVRQAIDTDLTDNQAKLLLMRVMALTDQFLQMLWLVKDNSANNADGTIALAVPTDGVTHLFTQRPGGLNFTSDCHRRHTPFSAEEVETAIGYFRKFSAINPQIEWNLDAPRPSALINRSRIVRTIYFAQGARKHAELGIKLAFYCICFESLFASESDSISHRVAERAAFLLGGSSAERQTVYRDIRKLYSVRSKVVHGAPLNESQLEALRQVSVSCDDHLRRAIRLILDGPELLDLFSQKSSEAIDAYFLNQLFPGS